MSDCKTEETGEDVTLTGLRTMISQGRLNAARREVRFIKKVSYYTLTTV